MKIYIYKLLKMSINYIYILQLTEYFITHYLILTYLKFGYFNSAEIYDFVNI